MRVLTVEYGIPSGVRDIATAGRVVPERIYLRDTLSYVAIVISSPHLQNN